MTYNIGHNGRPHGNKEIGHPLAVATVVDRDTVGETARSAGRSIVHRDMLPLRVGQEHGQDRGTGGNAREQVEAGVDESAGFARHGHGGGERSWQMGRPEGLTTETTKVANDPTTGGGEARTDDDGTKLFPNWASPREGRSEPTHHHFGGICCKTEATDDVTIRPNPVEIVRKASVATVRTGMLLAFAWTQDQRGLKR